MPSWIATNPVHQFFNDDGTLLVGGLLYTYLAGSTTPVTTYQNEALNSANTNPIELDARGECVIWLDTTKAYKFALHDADDSEIYVVDNVQLPETDPNDALGNVEYVIETVLGSVTPGDETQLYDAIVALAVDEVTSVAQMPVGGIIFVAGNAAPTGYLNLIGQEVSRGTYPELWAYANASGNITDETTWAATRNFSFSTGDGSTTFRLPDYRGRFVRVLDQSKGIDTARGIGTVQAGQNLAHSHKNGIADDNAANQAYVYTTTTDDVPGNATRAMQSESATVYEQGLTSSDGGTETRVNNGAALACICYTANPGGDTGKYESFILACSDETTPITTGNAKVTFRMPYAFTLTEIPRASLTTASSSGTPTVDINEAGVSIFSTRITIDANEKTSFTAAVPAVLSDSSLANDAEITVDIDVAGTGAAGLKVYIIGQRA